MRLTAALLISVLGASPTTASPGPLYPDELLVPGPVIPSHPKPDPIQPAEHKFTLRHIYHHGSARYPELHRKMDIHPDRPIRVASDDKAYDDWELPTLIARSRGEYIERLVDRRPSVIDPLVAEARRGGFSPVMDASAWTMDEVPSPNVTDKETVLTMAYMAANAYVEKEGETDWHDVGDEWHNSDDFGWESDGLRGHVFADENNSTIVIGLKGTSVSVWDGTGTTTKDKVNDNLFFSCCCGQQGQWTWKKVCDCATGTFSCNNTCVRQTLIDENHYYKAARELYSNVTERYPDSTVWLTGHSLGGAVASLLGLTYGNTAITFEAVPEALAASRLGLPVPPGSDSNTPQTRQNTGSYHFGHTADPIYIGTCNGAYSVCSFAGYAMESACHTGRECIYDVVADLGWRVGIGTHRISQVIKDVLEKYDHVPVCEFNAECRDCGQWKMYESNNTESTTSARPTSTITSRTRTRTATCETPGWWGCLDKTASMTNTGDTPVTTIPHTTRTITTSTSTCKTPGWFGCWDKTTTTTTSTTTATTTTCSTPGKWYGCWDTVTTTTTTKTTEVPSATASTCKTPGLWFGCWDETTSTRKTTTQQRWPHPTTTKDSGGPTTTTQTNPTSTAEPTCLLPGLFWGCWDWDWGMAVATATTGSGDSSDAAAGLAATNTAPMQTQPPMVMDEM